LYEELFFGPGDAMPTSHPKILQARDGDTTVAMNGDLTALISAARRREQDKELRRRVHYLVPEYVQLATNGDGNGRRIRAQVPEEVLVAIEPLRAAGSFDDASRA
jgi:hypothetical protein